MLHKALNTALDRRRFLASAGLIGGFAAAPGWAQPAARALGWTPVEALLQSYAPSRVPGVVGAVARGTTEASFLSSGTLGRDNTTPVGPDSLFRVYSMSKPITGIAAMLLVEDRRIGLDQDIGDFIPGFKKPMVATDPATSLIANPARRPITVRHLLTHTAGLGYLITSKGPLLTEYVKAGLTGGVVSRMDLPGLPKITPAPTLKDFADRIAALPLMYEPGARWSYSASLDVLGRVIEVASAMPFDRFLATRIFDPLGMKSSFFRVPASELGRMTTNYGILGQNQLPIDPGATTIFAEPGTLPLGGGGLVMSPRDYDMFLRMLAGRGAVGPVRIMKEATAKLAMSNLLPPTATTEGTFATGQGFGAGGRVTIASDPNGSGIGTFGWGGAAATIGFVDPTNNVRASGFAQFMPSEAMPFTRDFGRSVYASL